MIGFKGIKSFGRPGRHVRADQHNKIKYAFGRPLSSLRSHLVCHVVCRAVDEFDCL